MDLGSFHYLKLLDFEVQGKEFWTRRIFLIIIIILCLLPYFVFLIKRKLETANWCVSSCSWGEGWNRPSAHGDGLCAALWAGGPSGPQPPAGNR